MIHQCDRKIILQDGTEFYGYGFGASGDCAAEIVFNTSMVGYQEILSDPSYTGQAIVMTYPLIGNYGMCGINPAHYDRIIYTGGGALALKDHIELRENEVIYPDAQIANARGFYKFSLIKG